MDNLGHIVVNVIVSTGHHTGQALRIPFDRVVHLWELGHLNESELRSAYSQAHRWAN